MNEHERHIAKHLGQLVKIVGKEKLDSFLQRVDLRYDGISVQPLHPKPLTERDCVRYVEYVREAYGAVAETFARANFALSGCRSFHFS